MCVCMVYVLDTWIDGPADTSDSRQGAQEAETDSTLNNFRTRVDRNHEILWVCQERVSGNSLCESECVCVTVCVWAKMAARQTQRGSSRSQQKATMRQIERQTDRHIRPGHTQKPSQGELGRGKKGKGKQRRGRKREKSGRVSGEGRRGNKKPFFKATGQVSRKFCRFSCCVIQNEW